MLDVLACRHIKKKTLSYQCWWQPPSDTGCIYIHEYTGNDKHTHVIMLKTSGVDGQEVSSRTASGTMQTGNRILT